ncbi:PRC-barrel domain-containing protein, partial [Microvirga aerophila]
MTQTAATPDTTPSHPLIESNRVEGTPVYDPRDKRIGAIHHLVIEKVSGRVVYAVMSFGGFL